MTLDLSSVARLVLLNWSINMTREELKEMFNRLKEQKYYEHQDQTSSRGR